MDASPAFDGEAGQFPLQEFVREVGLQQAFIDEERDLPSTHDMTRGRRMPIEGCLDAMRSFPQNVDWST